MSQLSTIMDMIIRIVNLCFTIILYVGYYYSCKNMVYMPVGNLPFVSKFIEHAIITLIHSHLITNELMIIFSLLINLVTAVVLLYYECKMILLLRLVDVRAL